MSSLTSRLTQHIILCCLATSCMHFLSPWLLMCIDLHLQWSPKPCFSSCALYSHHPFSFIPWANSSPSVASGPASTPKPNTSISSHTLQGRSSPNLKLTDPKCNLTNVTSNRIPLYPFDWRYLRDNTERQLYPCPAFH